MVEFGLERGRFLVATWAYAKVTVKLQTHRVRAVTYSDIELAVRIQEVVLWTPPEEGALDGFPKRRVH